LVLIEEILKEKRFREGIWRKDLKEGFKGV
jgi:hypothetical protein